MKNNQSLKLHYLDSEVLITVKGFCEFNKFFSTSAIDGDIVTFAKFGRFCSASVLAYVLFITCRLLRKRQMVCMRNWSSFESLEQI